MSQYPMQDRSMPDATLRDFEDIIRETDPGELRGSEGYNAKLVLLSSLKVGQSLEALANFTGLPRTFVDAIVMRMVENGVWIGGEWVNLSPWSGDESGTDFNICTNIALGRMAYDPPTEMLRLTPKGMEHAKDLMERQEGGRNK